jgi:hypothetical protein
MSAPEPQEDEAGDILQDRRRQTLSDGHAQRFRDEIDYTMEIYEEQKPVRRRPGGGENKETPGENMDVEGVHWGGLEVGPMSDKLAPRTKCRRQLS